MTEQLVRADDHVLVISAPPHGQRPSSVDCEVICPHERDGRPGNCAYLEECPCGAVYEGDSAAVQAMIDAAKDAGLGLAQPAPYDGLGHDDWIDGCTVTFEHGLVLSVPGHEVCPHSGKKHTRYEDIFGTQTGECAVRAEWRENDLADDLEGKEPGRYPLSYEWDEGVYVWFT